MTGYRVLLRGLAVPVALGVGPTLAASLPAIPVPAMHAGIASAIAVAAAPGLPPLAGIREEVVVSGMVVNGNRLDLNRFTDPRPASLLLAEVGRIWSQRPAPIQRGAREGWMTLTQLVGESVETFEVGPAPSGNGAQGWRIRWRAAEMASADADDWLAQVLPPDSRVLDRVGNHDGSRRLTTLVAATPAPSAAALRSLSAALARRGFDPEERAASSFDGTGMARFFVRGVEEIAVTISEHAGQRAIVIHYRSSER